MAGASDEEIARDDVRRDGHGRGRGVEPRRARARSACRSTRSRVRAERGRGAPQILRERALPLGLAQGRPNGRRQEDLDDPATMKSIIALIKGEKV